MLIGKYIVSFIFLCMNGIILFGQNQSGKIVYERKTNLAKKFNYIQEDWMTEFLETNKYKIDVFELYFTDSSSIFKPEETDEELKLHGQENGNKWGNLPEAWKEGDTFKLITGANNRVTLLRSKE